MESVALWNKVAELQDCLSVDGDQLRKQFIIKKRKQQTDETEKNIQIMLGAWEDNDSSMSDTDTYAGSLV